MPRHRLLTRRYPTAGHASSAVPRSRCASTAGVSSSTARRSAAWRRGGRGGPDSGQILSGARNVVRRSSRGPGVARRGSSARCRAARQRTGSGGWSHLRPAQLRLQSSPAPPSWHRSSRGRGPTENRSSLGTIWSGRTRRRWRRPLYHGKGMPRRPEVASLIASWPPIRDTSGDRSGGSVIVRAMPGSSSPRGPCSCRRIWSAPGR